MPAAQSAYAVADAGSAPQVHTMVSRLLTCGGALLTAHYQAPPLGGRPDGQPSSAACPLQLIHEDDLPDPTPGLDGCLMVLRTLPGTLLVVNRGRCGGFQVPETGEDVV